MVLPEPKNLNYNEMFKSKIRKSESIQCNLYLPYIQNVGYTNITRSERRKLTILHMSLQYLFLKNKRKQ